MSRVESRFPNFVALYTWNRDELDGIVCNEAIKIAHDIKVYVGESHSVQDNHSSITGTHHKAGLMEAWRLGFAKGRVGNVMTKFLGSNETKMELFLSLSHSTMFAGNLTLLFQRIPSQQ